MKHFYTLIFWLSFGLLGNAQCPSGVYTFTTQTQVDNFSSNFPNCTNADFISIVGTNITNLQGLNQIKTVKYLKIHQTDLETLDGLGNLSTCNSWVRIQDNEKLKDISSLSSLTFLGSLIFINNKIFDGSLPLMNVSTMKSIKIQDNSSLTKIEGVMNIEDLSEFLTIDGNPNLNSMNGFEQLKKCRRLEILNNSLTSLDHFPALKDIEYLSIQYNENLTDISMLDGLTSILKQARVNDNQKLSACSSLCNIVDDNTILEIGNNRPGCNSQRTIKCPDFISGAVFYDKNRNQILDDDEFGIPNIVIEKNDSDYWLVTEKDGGFGFLANLDSQYAITPHFDENEWLLTTDSSAFHFKFDQNNQAFKNLNFGVVAIKEQHGLELFLNQSTNRKSSIIVKNTGPFYESAKVEFWFDSDLYFSHASIPESEYDTLSNKITWLVPDMKPFETVIIKIDYGGFGSPVGISYSSHAKLYQSTESVWKIVDTKNIVKEFAFVSIFESYFHFSVFPVGETQQHLIKSDTNLTYTTNYLSYGDTIYLENKLDGDLDLSSFKFVYSDSRVKLKMEDSMLFFLFDDLSNPGVTEQVLYQLKPKDDLPEGTRLDVSVLGLGRWNSELNGNCFNTIKSDLRPWTISDDDLLIGPNPTSDFFRIQSSAVYKDVHDANLLIYNSLGQLIRSFKVKSNKRYFVDGMPSGVYSVVLQSDSNNGMRLVGKLFVQ